VKRLVVDLTNVAFCDSTGLRALIGAGREIGVDGGRFAIVCPPTGAVARLFDITGARESLRVFVQRGEALAALGRVA
jgi:anti-anti-sigma factor